MWEAYELGSEDLLWSGIGFTGGIGGQQQAPCGAISAAAIFIGLHYRRFATDKQKTKQARLDTREHANELVNSFIERFGNITCRELVGIDFSEPGEYQRFHESGVWQEKCDHYVQFIVEKLYELDAKRSAAKIPEQVLIYTQPGCPFCAQAKQDLEERGVPYREMSIQDNPEAAQEVMRLSNGKGIVPILVIGEEVKVGFGGG